MAERWEVVFDFSPFKNQNVTLKSNAKVADVDPYLHTDKVMRFVVRDRRILPKVMPTALC